MKAPLFVPGSVALSCAFALMLPGGTAAVVDDQQFNELKELVTKLSQKVEKQDQRIEQLEKTHAQDQKTILDLGRKLGENSLGAPDAQ